MTSFVGADVRQLTEFALHCKTAGEELLTHALALEAAVLRSTWAGADAEGFRQQWKATLLPAVRGASERVLSAGAEALRQAIAQDMASGGFDAASYGALLEGSSWSELINWVQDRLPARDKLTLEALHGYVENPDLSKVVVDGNPSVFADIDNMSQGAIGDCWLVSALAAVGQRDPGFLDRHINEVKPGVWEVTLYRDGQPTTVVVDAQHLPNNAARNADNSLGWMSVYEAAVAQHYGNDYDKLVADSPAAGLELVTGKPVDQYTLGIPSLNDLDAAVKAGKPITAMSDPLLPLRSDVAAAHVYTVESVNIEKGTITVVNPWGPPAGQSRYGDRIEIPAWQWNTTFVMTGVGATS